MSADILHRQWKTEAYVVLGSKDLERGLDDTSSESENEVESGFLLDVWLSVEALVSVRRSRPPIIHPPAILIVLRLHSIAYPHGLAVLMFSHLRCPLSTLEHYET